MATHRIDHRMVESGLGWNIGLTVFAGSLMVLTGVFHFLVGLVAIFNNEFFVIGTQYLYKIDVTTWGWIHLVVGAIVAFAGMSVFSGSAWARGIGIFLAGLSAIANFFYIPYYPFWSLLIIALDIAIIGALASYNAAAEEVEQ